MPMSPSVIQPMDNLSKLSHYNLFSNYRRPIELKLMILDNFRITNLEFGFNTLSKLGKNIKYSQT